MSLPSNVTIADPKSRRRQSGLSYIEVLIVIVVTATALVPAIDGLRSNLVSTRAYGDQVESHHQLMSRLESTLAEPFTALESASDAAGSASVATNYSDTGGTPNRLLVFLSRYDGDDADGDGDPFTGTDDDLIWIRVRFEVGGQEIESITQR